MRSTAIRLVLCAVLAAAFVGCDDDDSSKLNSTTPTFTPTATASPTPTEPALEWSTYGRTQDRTFFNPFETRINRGTIAGMLPKWQYTTAAIVTASPAVVYVDVPGEGRIKVVIVSSWDGTVYALRASNGSSVWKFKMKPHPGASYPQASSAEITTVAGEQRVYVAGGMTLYCLEAASGALRWEFDAGTGCTTCGPRVERNEIESSPAVVDGLVYFGMDINDRDPGKGGTYAIDAADGRLVWYFDLETGATCRPLPSDNIRRFDGFHTAAELGLPDGFFATRPGCNFDRAETACGNVWSSFTVDRQRRLIYTASSNCDTDDDPETPDPPPPMPPYDEAVFALTFEGAPAWVWRPREVDVNDLSFGAVPNLFQIQFGGATREVIGVGNKDGTYYVLDRDGVNEITGTIEPYWQTKVVPGGPIGGIISSASVGLDRILFATAIGVTLSSPQRPAAWGLKANDGAVLWSNRNAAPNYAASTATESVVFMGSLFGGVIARDADTGDQLRMFGPISPTASAVTILDGEIFYGTGVGERSENMNSEAYRTSFAASPISAFCLPDAPDCPTALCDDGDPCTYDFHGASGCESEPAPDGIPCGDPLRGDKCEAGVCRAGV